jgi:hypothetical protein
MGQRSTITGVDAAVLVHNPSGAGCELMNGFEYVSLFDLEFEFRHTNGSFVQG